MKKGKLGQRAVKRIEAETEPYESSKQRKLSMKTKANKGKNSDANQIFEKNPPQIHGFIATKVFAATDDLSDLKEACLWCRLSGDGN